MEVEGGGRIWKEKMKVEGGYGGRRWKWREKMVVEGGGRRWRWRESNLHILPPPPSSPSISWEKMEDMEEEGGKRDLRGERKGGAESLLS